MKFYLYILLIALTAASFPVVAFTEETVSQDTLETDIFAEMGGKKTFEHTGAGFSIDYPASWTPRTDNLPSPSIVLALISPVKSQKIYSPNVVVVVEDPGEQEMDLQKYVEISLETAKKNLKGFRLLEKKELSLDSRKAIEIYYSSVHPQAEIRYYTIFFFHRGKGYNATFADLSGDFEKNSTAGIAIARSLRLK